MEEAPVEASACATGLAALVRAVERQVLAALQAALSAFFAQARRSHVVWPALVPRHQLPALPSTEGTAYNRLSNMQSPR